MMKEAVIVKHKEIATLNSRLTYPSYEVIQSPLRFLLHTYVRKEKNGIWYLIPVVNSCEFYKQTPEYKRDILREETLKLFLKNVYNVILFYIIDVNLVNNFNRSVIYKDGDQRSEEERLIFNLKYEEKKEL